jgi:hypothetical protein
LTPKEPVEIGFGYFEERAAQRHAGIVNENIGSAMCRHYLCGQRGDRRAASDVETMVAHSKLPCSLLAGDFGRATRQRRLVDIGKREVAAAAGERKRNAAADAAGRPRHHRRAACELQHYRSPLSGRPATGNGWRPGGEGAPPQR